MNINELESTIKKFWPNSSLELEITKTPGKIQITVSAMYETPDLNFDILEKLANLFGTKDINDDDRFSHGGCETCDYGNSYGYTLVIRNPTLEIE